MKNTTVKAIGKAEMIKVMAGRTGLPKTTCMDVMNSFLSIVQEELAKGNKVSIPGFGTFEVSEREERIGRNPQTGEEMIIPASKSPKFKAGKSFKEAVNK